MSKSKMLTATWLRRRNACEDQVAIFEQEWPNGTEITTAVIQRARELELNVGWLIAQLPAPAREAYKKAGAPAWEAYQKALATAQEAYHKAVAPAIVQAWEEGRTIGLVAPVAEAGARR